MGLNTWQKCWIAVSGRLCTRNCSIVSASFGHSPLLAAKHELIDTSLRFPFAVDKDPVKALTLSNALDWVVVEEEDDDDDERPFSGVLLMIVVRCVVTLVLLVVSVVLVYSVSVVSVAGVCGAAVCGAGVICD